MKAKAKKRPKAKAERERIEQQFYTISQVAQLTGHSTRAVSRWINRKENPLPHKRVSYKTVLIPRSAFADLIKS